MPSLSLRYFFALSLAISALALTGCATGKKPKTQVVVTPIAQQLDFNANANYPNPYMGEPLVQNVLEVQQAAAAISPVVHFDFNSDLIRPDAAAILNEHAAFLSQQQDARIQIAGHTDDRGSREYNISLGERRAAAVRAYLEIHGVNSANVEIISYGEEQPIDPAQNEEAWAKNRRAELSY